MKKNIAIGCLLTAAFLANCTYQVKSTPQIYTDDVTLAPADYTVLGETSGKSCGGNIFGIFRHGNTSKYGSGLLTLDFVTENAYYDALSKLENATYILNPKIEETGTNYLIYSDRCVTIKARGIQLKNGPVGSK
ncbi:hypothetical protein AB3N61_05735 [Leptospira sp. WS58.C1]|uniref:hypothetical protein n=1 Tax=Leptospira cinconiae TaxID=3235173 RepID=UPI00349EC1D2